LADLVDAEYRSTAVAHINLALVIKRQARRDPQIGSHGLNFLERRDAIERTVVTAGHVKRAFAAESHARWADNVGDEGRYRVVRSDFIDRNGNLLAALPRQRHIDAAVIAIDRRVSDRVKILRYLRAEFKWN